MAAAPWIYLSGALALSYLTYIDPNDFREFEWVRQTEWLPVLVMFGLAILVLLPSVHSCFSPHYMYNVHMNGLLFEWDPRKEKTNVKKHGVSFEEARTAFYDENAILFSDPDHSEDEDRFILLGLSLKLRILVVCHCFREKETVIRIISARKADKDEELEYWKQRK